MHLDILMPVLMNERDRVGLGTDAVAMSTIEVIGSALMSMLRLMAMPRLVNGV